MVGLGAAVQRTAVMGAIGTCGLGVERKGLGGRRGRRKEAGALLGTVAGVVTERAREEAEILMAEGGVDERVATELFRVLRLVEMDVEMVKAAVKEETVKERVETARARCRQAILVALSL